MSATLVFLHGVGDPPKVAWQPELNEALVELGYRSLTELDVVEPEYRSLLRANVVPPIELPEPTEWPRSLAVARRATYERQQSSMRRLLELDAPGTARPYEYPAGPVDWVAAAAIQVHANLKQAQLYRDEEKRRHAITAHVLAELSGLSDLVIVGHSLGSLVALDLLPYLGKDVTVRRLITIGSPVGIRWMHERTERLLRRFPFAQVGSWLNVVSTRDLITAQHGASRLFPPAVDLVIRPERRDDESTRHGAADYLREEKPAKALGEAMFGSQSTALARIDQSLVLRPTDPESQVVFSIAYAHLVADELKGDNRDDYRGALGVVQSETYRLLAENAAAAGRAISPTVADLESGLATAIPRCWADDLDAAMRLLITAATTNLVAPYEIPSSKSSLAVLDAAAVGLGFGRRHGEVVREAVQDAQECFERSLWTRQRLMLGAAGLAILVTGPIGLALAAPAGLAGAAAITSALAAFGPGGMIGGMTLAGALVSSGAIATTAAALVEGPAASLNLEILRRMALALVRKNLDLAIDPADWLLLVSIASQVDAEIARLGAFSDEDSATMRGWADKRDLLRKALRWMAEHELGPGKLADRE